MKVRDKFLAIILPIVLLGFIIMTVFAVNSVKSVVDLDTEHTMENTLATKDAEISGELMKIKNTAETLADALSANYNTATIDEVGIMMKNVVSRSSDTVYGMGIWFEPYTILEKEGETEGTPIKWVGPYYYKDGNEIVMTEEYANDEYNYIEQEYYLLAKTSSHDAVFTNPYYDPTSGVIMASCVAPMYDNDKYIGCVTVDIEITSLQNIVESAVLRNNGVLRLIDSEGTFLAGIEHDKIAAALNIADEENFSKYANEIINNKDGNFIMSQEGTEWVTYYKELSSVKWTLIMQMDQSSLNKRLVSTRTALYITVAIILLIVATAILVMINSMVKRIQKSLEVMNKLADGDYSIKVEEGSQGANEFNNMEYSINPGMEFRVESVSSRSLYQGLIDAKYDLIISVANENLNLPERFEEFKFKKSAPKLIISSSHPAYHPDMLLSDLKEYPMYIFSSMFSINAKRQIISHCQNIGDAPKKIEEFDAVGSLEMALYSGNGYTLTFPEFVRNSVGKLEFIPLQKPDDEAGFSIAYPKVKKKVFEPFMEALREIANQ